MWSDHRVNFPSYSEMCSSLFFSDSLSLSWQSRQRIVYQSRHKWSSAMGTKRTPAHVQVFRVETGLVGLETFRGKHFETSFAKYIRDSRALFLSFLSFFLSFFLSLLSFFFCLFCFCWASGVSDISQSEASWHLRNSAVHVGRRQTCIVRNARVPSVD